MGEVVLHNEVTLTTILCTSCGIEFGVPVEYDRENERTGATFHCPNGHARVYRETTETKLRRELEQAQARITFEKARAERAEKERASAEHARAITAGKHAALEKRIHAGVCPHCQRTFQQLARHMKTKHPKEVS